MRRSSHFALWVLAGGLAAAMGCGELAQPNLDNPLENSSLPVPQALRASVGDARVDLVWNAATGVDGYRVFRRADGESGFTPLADVTGTSYTDSPVHNGRTYEYAVASRGAGDTVGRRSSSVRAMPNLFSVIVGDGRIAVGSQLVTLGLSYPEGTAYMIVANSADFAGASWETARTTRTWFLTPDDGTKTVYVKFRDAGGLETQPVSDQIELDTVAQIRSLSVTAPAPIEAGSVVRLRLDAGETYGEATVRFGLALTGIELRDDGTLGDATPADGVFERDLVVDGMMTVLGEPATGSYVDGAGNHAPDLVSPDSLWIAFYPRTVSLASVLPSGRAKLTLQWTQSDDPGFDEYRIYRSPDAVVDVLDELVETVGQRSTLQWSDTGLHEGATYHYRVFVRSRNGLEAGGNVLAGTVSDLVPLQPVLYLPTNIGPTTMTLRWDPSPITDFLRYRLYRSAVPGVSDLNGTLVFEGTLQDLNYYNDYGLATGTTYYYVLYVDDLGLKSNQSLEIVAATL